MIAFVIEVKVSSVGLQAGVAGIHWVGTNLC
jgi:hypothetical protein